MGVVEVLGDVIAVSFVVYLFLGDGTYGGMAAGRHVILSAVHYIVKYTLLFL